MKFRTPYSLYSTIDSSKRDTSNVIILPRKINTFLYIASELWNSIHIRILNENGEILTTSVSLVKLRCKNIILAFQSINNNNTWTYHNFHVAPHSVTDQYSSSLTHQTADPIQRRLVGAGWQFCWVSNRRPPHCTFLSKGITFKYVKLLL